MAALAGGVFLANELNRGDEYVLNSLLDALEERKLYVPSLKRWFGGDDKFDFLAAMNPTEARGPRRLPSAVQDRRQWRTELRHPRTAPGEEQLARPRRRA